MYDIKAHRKLALRERRSNPSSYNDFISIIESDIDTILMRMEKDSDKYLDSSEDELTAIICSMLEMLDYDSVEEQVHRNGAVDLSVKHLNYEWIAEAKLGTTLHKIFEGVLQLITRYVKRDKNAGILIYYQKHLALNSFNDFIDYLKTEKWRDASFSKDSSVLQELTSCFSNPKLINKSDQSCEMAFTKPNGGEITVKFYAADFHYSPVDKSGRDAKYLKRAAAKNQLLEKFHEWDDAEFCETYLTDIKNALDSDLSFSTSN